MKRIFTIFSMAIFALAANNVKAQTTYFTEYFDDGATAITGTTASAATTPTTATIKTGEWTTYYSFRSGSGCAPNDPIAASSPKTLRILSTGASSPTPLLSTNPGSNGIYAYLITPALNFGVNTISWKYFGTSTGAKIKIYTSTNGGTAWTLFGSEIVGAGTGCDNYSVTINNSAVNKIKFQNEVNTNYDIDNITITSTSTIVPVNFTSAKASLKNNGIIVEWNIANEVNVANYTIERSANGASFTTAGTVIATGTSKYSWFDAAPLSGNNFYRIKATDKDGSVKYTSILRVNTVTGSAAVNVAPNPVKGNKLTVQLSGVAKGNYTVSLYNNFGQQVYNKVITADGASTTQSLSLPASIIKGAYNLQVINADVKLNKKVIID